VWNTYGDGYALAVSQLHATVLLTGTVLLGTFVVATRQCAVYG